MKNSAYQDLKYFCIHFHIASFIHVIWKCIHFYFISHGSHFLTYFEFMNELSLEVPFILVTKILIDNGSGNSSVQISQCAFTWTREDHVIKKQHPILSLSIHYPSIHIYCKISNISRTISQNLNVSHLGLRWSLHNILKPSVKWRMKM